MFTFFCSRENGEPLSKGEIKRREKEAQKELKRIERDAKMAEEKAARETADVVSTRSYSLSPRTTLIASTRRISLQPATANYRSINLKNELVRIPFRSCMAKC